jgi:hypothetical protein
MTLIEDLNPIQQQAVIDILIDVQERRNISQQKAGLVGSTLENFPVLELKRLFKSHQNLLRATEKLMGFTGMSETGFINLKAVLGIVIEEEIQRRCEIKREKTLLDFADENQ